MCLKRLVDTDYLSSLGCYDELYEICGRGVHARIVSCWAKSIHLYWWECVVIEAEYATPISWMQFVIWFVGTVAKNWASILCRMRRLQSPEVRGPQARPAAWRMIRSRQTCRIRSRKSSVSMLLAGVGDQWLAYTGIGHASVFVYVRMSMCVWHELTLHRHISTNTLCTNVLWLTHAIYWKITRMCFFCCFNKCKETECVCEAHAKQAKRREGRCTSMGMVLVNARVYWCIHMCMRACVVWTSANAALLSHTYI